jgi:cysteine synthase A
VITPEEPVVKFVRNIIEAIGNTPLVELRKVVPDNHAKVLVKVEGINPTGSMKDRMALALIERAEGDGRLRPGGTVVEYTGGSTGTSLALICIAKGYAIRIVTSDAFSQEKRDHMRALGADLIEVPSEGGRTTKRLIDEMIRLANELSQKPGSFFSDQLNNPDGIPGYSVLGEEIWSQTEGHVDAFVQVVGTAHSIAGVGSALRRHNSDVRIFAVEPTESPVLSGGKPGGHSIEGIGIGFVPPLWKDELADQIVTVSTNEAKSMARQLAEREGLFAGTSSGANVVAAIQVAGKLGPGRTVVSLLIDSGLKYLSTDLYAKSGRGNLDLG